MSRSASDRSSNGAAETSSPAASATRGVRVEDVALHYGATPALRGVSLDVRAGELLALLGPSGSGKTTLLRAIAGLEAPDAGRVLFGEEDVTAHPVQARGIGFVFQHYALFRHMSVHDNIAYGLRARRRGRPPAPAIRARVAELLDLVQLGGLGARFPAQLSGGQRQRVALARALATEPGVLLLDEPFGALDAGVRKDLRRWLRALHRETGRTTLFVTHDQEEALELADRVAILNDGRIEQAGTPQDVLDDPATAFVAGFVGERTRLPVTVAGGAVHLGGHRLPVPAGGMPDGDALLFVRADDLALAQDGEGGLPALVTDVRRSGHGPRIGVRLAQTGIPLEIASHERGAPGAGSRVGVAIARGRLFPAAAGRDPAG